MSGVLTPLLRLVLGNVWVFCFLVFGLRLWYLGGVLTIVLWVWVWC